MNKKNQISLNASCLLNVPLQTFNNDFTFIVNDQEYKTSQLIATLLSPKIGKNILADQTFDEYIIHTHQTGNFQCFLNLLNFEKNDFQEEEISFIEEILEILENESIEIIIDDEPTEITSNNVFDLIFHHEKHCHFYSDQLTNEIDFLSSHFYEIEKSHEDKIRRISKATLEKILNNPKLRIRSEDQLISIINDLYSNDSSYSTFYEYIDFLNVSEQEIIEFLNIYNINDLTQETWKKILERFKNQIVPEKKVKTKNSKSFGSPIYYQKNHEFSGIINYIRMNSKGNIFSEIEMTCSSILDEKSCSPQNAILFEEKNKNFVSKNDQDSWLCIDFKKHKVVPKNYSIRSYSCGAGGFHPKSWVIEGSNDKINWEIIDNRENCSLLNEFNVIHTFIAENPNDEAFQYLRMRITSSNWNKSSILAINSIEFYGRLI